MILFKSILILFICFLVELLFAEGVWAWGPAIHTAISCEVLKEISGIVPNIAGVIQSFSLEYIYGSLAADFFIGKGQKKKNGHSHNWEAGFRFLEEAGTDREASYAYGFLSHLAADVVAHNYFVPNHIKEAPTWKRMGHLYCEAKADYCVGPAYIRMARNILSMENLDCDALLKSAVGRNNGFRARRHLYTQSVKVSDFLSVSHAIYNEMRGFRDHKPYDYISFMIHLSYRLVRDFLARPDDSPCLSYDPIGSTNLRLARRRGMVSKLLNIPLPTHMFQVDQELLRL